MRIITEKISKNHNDSFWYDGDIASIDKSNGTKLLLIAAGDIQIHNKEGTLVHDGWKERNEGIKNGMIDDNDLRKIGNNYDDDYYWENNNWFEILYKQKNVEGYDSIMGDVAYDYDSAIRLLNDYKNDNDF